MAHRFTRGTLDSQILIKDRWNLLEKVDDIHLGIFKAVREHWELDGKKISHPFTRLESKDWVVVIAIDEHCNFVLVNQFRHGSQDESLEFPCGAIEPGEDIIKAGLRELQEETGYTISHLKDARLIGSFSPNPAFMSNQVHVVFLSKCGKTSEPTFDEGELCQVVTTDYIDVFKINSGIMLAAWALFMR